MKRVAIVQARTSSSRLPGKVLEPINGIPMIVFMLQRVARAKQLDHLTLATSTDDSDDVLCKRVEQAGFDCYRGNLLDVLDRFNCAAKFCAADVVVRLTGDCPLMDSDVIDRCVSTLVEGRFDYVSNVDPPTFPNGLDVEAFTYEALAKAHLDAHLATDREHVTPYIRRNKTLFRQANVCSSVDLSELRWTVDHADDLSLIRALTGSVNSDNLVLADRFDFLRALEVNQAKLPKNDHDRYERYDETMNVLKQKNHRGNSGAA
jgi:spore coat polysaccharide biosynthesis protein SpsF (cytidylyltransferase family)